MKKYAQYITNDTDRIALIDTLTVDQGAAVSTMQNELRYQCSNHLGSATLELDGAGQIISYEEYHPFGSSSYRAGKTKPKPYYFNRKSQ